jgi:acyl carrier protein
MDKEKIKEELNYVFQKVFDDPSLKIFESMTAKDVEDWDSLSHIRLIVEVEKHFSISLTTKEVKSLPNVGEFIELINRKKN